jgi:acyl-CoA reductase-like NAD-dependent aldehyde dehydrogenase
MIWSTRTSRVGLSGPIARAGTSTSSAAGSANASINGNGKNLLVIMPDADLDSAVPWMLRPASA